MALHNSSPNPGLVSPMPIYGLYKSSPNPDWSCVSSMPIWPYTGLHQTWIGLVNLQCQYGLTQVFTKPGLVFKSSMPIAMALHKSLNWSCASSMPIWPYTPSPNLDWPCVCSIRGLKQTVLHYIGLRSFEHLQCYW